MGYTHYVTRPRNNLGSAEMYGKLALDAKAICEYAQSNGIALGDWDGQFGTQPSFTEGRFSLNGVDDGHTDYSHESFVWDALPSQPEHRKNDPNYFMFCKTAYKPYDAVVTAILIRAKVIYGSFVTVSSDGNWADWELGQRMYANVFGEAAECPFNEVSV